MIYASYDHNMPTFKVFLSLFFLFHFLCLQKLYIHRYLWEKLFLCTPTFLYTTNFFCIHTNKKLFLFISTRSIINLYSCSKISFSFFNIHSWFTQKFLYIHSLLTHKNFFSHIIYTHKILLYTFFFYIYKNSFLFFVYIDTTFVHNASFFFLFLALSCFLFILFSRWRS